MRRSPDGNALPLRHVLYYWRRVGLDARQIWTSISRKEAILPASITFDEKLQKYAQVICRVGGNLQPGQRLILTADIEQRQLARHIIRLAYQMGVRLVEPFYYDDLTNLIRFQEAPRDSFEEVATWRIDALVDIAQSGDCYIDLDGRSPDLLEGQDPELIAVNLKARSAAAQPYYQLMRKGISTWCAVAVAGPAWADKVLPQLPQEQRQAALWEMIFDITRVNLADPVAAWQAHISELRLRRDFLDGKQYHALRLTGPGTDLTVHLAPDHRWQGGQSFTQSGLPFSPNIPTEELFTMPHKSQVEGVVRNSKPLSLSGVIVDGFELRFQEGKVVDFSAQTGEDSLRRLLDMDEGARRLGEIALVPHSSPISRSGMTFFQTLIDENASSHIALGQCYNDNLAGGQRMSEEEIAAAGGNRSNVHVDFMIGTDQMDVDGVTAGGGVEPVMRGGEWTFQP